MEFLFKYPALAPSSVNDAYHLCEQLICIFDTHLLPSKGDNSILEPPIQTGFQKDFHISVLLSIDFSWIHWRLGLIRLYKSIFLLSEWAPDGDSDVGDKNDQICHKFVTDLIHYHHRCRGSSIGTGLCSQDRSVLELRPVATCRL